MLVGILEAARADAASDARAADQVTRDECLARLHQAEHADHYLVLGIDSKASPTEIRSAYYTLARRFHPDRFSTGPMADLRPRIESYFTQVTEAYNTLSDPDHRKQYDEDLASRLAEIRKAPDRDTTRLARENFARARVLLDKKRYQDAVTFLENAVQLDDTRFEYHFELGKVLTLNPRRRKDAEQHLIRASEIDPTSVPALVAMGKLLRRMGREAEATAKFEEALRWEPENVEARQALEARG
jgi:curved DNA-binding protein CbpA